MSTNEVFASEGSLTLTLAVASGTVSGDPILIGTLQGVAETDRNADGNAQVRIPYTMVYDFSVAAVNNVGNSAVAIGDEIFYETGATPVLNKDNVAGVHFGVALEAIATGVTATIRVAIG